MIEIGTRSRQNTLHIRPPGGSITRSSGTDIGLTKRADGTALTFSAGSSNVSGANGSLPGFALNDVIEVEGVNLNNGYFTVTAIDAVNQASLTLSPPPKDEVTGAGYSVRSA